MAETKNQEIVENIKTDVDGDLLHCSVKLYKFFLANDAMDAFRVYLHLMFTSRLQGTNQVWATPDYLKKGCALGEAKIKKAKRFLREHGLIDYVRTRPSKESPHLGKVYIKLNFDCKEPKLKLVKPKDRIRHVSEKEESTGSISTRVEINTSCSGGQILKEKKRNALRKKRKEEEPFFFGYLKRNKATLDLKAKLEKQKQYRRDYIEYVRGICEKNTGKLFNMLSEDKLWASWFDERTNPAYQPYQKLVAW